VAGIRAEPVDRDSGGRCGAGHYAGYECQRDNAPDREHSQDAHGPPPKHELAHDRASPPECPRATLRTSAEANNAQRRSVLVAVVDVRNRRQATGAAPSAVYEPTIRGTSRRGLHCACSVARTSQAASDPLGRTPCPCSSTPLSPLSATTWASPTVGGRFNASANRQSNWFTAREPSSSRNAADSGSCSAARARGGGSAIKVSCACSVDMTDPPVSTAESRLSPVD